MTTRPITPEELARLAAAAKFTHADIARLTGMATDLIRNGDPIAGRAVQSIADRITALLPQ